MRALQRIECDAALSAGVNMILAPATMVGNATAGFTSVRGRSHTFDMRADGYARGEAVDGFACRAGDKDSSIRFLGSAVRQDGRSASLTAPNGQAQQGVLSASLADARLVNDQMAVLEAHGTGTALGDPIEAGAVAPVFLEDRTVNPFIISSLKANAGHTEPGAGLAGALKLLVQLRSTIVSPNAHLRSLNTHVGASLRSTDSCVLPTKVSHCGQSDLTNGGVSSFGYAGTISHAVLCHASRRPGMVVALSSRVVFKRRSYPWVESGFSASTSSVDPSDSKGIFTTAWSTAPLPRSSTVRLLLVHQSMSSAVAFDRSLVAPHSHAHSSLPQRVAVLLVSSTSATPALAGTTVLLALVPVLAANKLPLNITLMCATGEADPLGAPQAASAAAHSGAWGFARCLRIEPPAVQVQSLGVPCNAARTEVQVAAMMSSNHDKEPELIFGLGATASFASRLRRCAGIAVTNVQSVTPGGFAIAGGLGGLGLRAATMLADCGALTLVLSSRSGHITRDGQQLDKQLMSLHTTLKAKVVANDVGDGADVCFLLADQMLTGVLHAAGLLRDKPARSMDDGDLDVVLKSKAVAASHLLSTTQTKPLITQAYFSSWTSIFGSPGASHSHSVPCARPCYAHPDPSDCRFEPFLLHRASQLSFS
jgi:hypothetical protein